MYLQWAFQLIGVDKIPLESLQDEVRENVAGRLNDELDG